MFDNVFDTLYLLIAAVVWFVLLLLTARMLYAPKGTFAREDNDNVAFGIFVATPLLLVALLWPISLIVFGFLGFAVLVQHAVWFWMDKRRQ
jgi:hypothetical protein